MSVFAKGDVMVRGDQKPRGRIEFTTSWMFNFIVRKEDVCEQLIERILGIEIDHIEFENTEQVLDPAVDGRGVRLDVYAKGSSVAFDVEMQAQPEYYLGQRMRYYQSAIDFDLLNKGMEYSDLPQSYIIFIGLSDFYGRGLPVYTLEPRCLEDDEISAGCRMRWLVLNSGDWEKERDAGLRALLQYVKDGTVTEGDDFIEQIERLVVETNNDEKVMSKMISVSTIEENAERRVRMAERYYREVGMEEGREEGLALGLAEGRAKGRAEGRVEGLAEGRAEESDRFSALVQRLIADGREGELPLLGDNHARNQLLEEYGL